MYNFSEFEGSNESTPNSSCHFWNHKVKVYSSFASLFSVIKDSCSVFFLAQTSYILNKNSPSKWSFWAFEGWVKIHFWSQVSVFLQALHHFSISWAITLLCFFHLNLYMLWTKGSDHSASFHAFDCLHEN